MNDGIAGERRRTLVLMRHAKSAWPPGVADIQRPLNERGRRDAPEAGRWIAREIGPTDLIVTSPAQRTRQTVELVASAWPEWSSQAEAIVDERIYEASWTDLAAVVHGLGESATTVLVVGHNPGLEDFAARWPDTAAPEAVATLAEKFPTSALAVVEVVGPWIAPARTRLTQIAVPRG